MVLLVALLGSQLAPPLAAAPRAVPGATPSGTLSRTPCCCSAGMLEAPALAPVPAVDTPMACCDGEPSAPSPRDVPLDGASCSCRTRAPFVPVPLRKAPALHGSEGDLGRRIERAAAHATSVCAPWAGELRVPRGPAPPGACGASPQGDETAPRRAVTGTPVERLLDALALTGIARL